MFTSSSTASPSTGLWRRAWTASLVLHLTATVLMGLLVQRLPRGADLGAGNSMVIDLSTGDGDLDFGHDPTSITSGAEAPVAPTILDQPPTGLATEPVPAQLVADLPNSVPTSATASGGDVQPSINPFMGSGRSSFAREDQPADPSGSPRSAAPRGRPAGGFGGSRSTAEVFGVKGTGSKFVYLFDRSTSMEGPPLAAAKRQLVASLQSLNSVNQFQIIFFNSQPYPLDVTGVGRMAFADERNKRMAANMIGHVTADLGTDRYAALKAAIAFRPDVIFFLTDAEDEMLSGEISEILRANERAGAMICVIEFGRSPLPPRENFLKRLARESGGQYGYVDTSGLSR
jgi:hypothetical protein